MSVANSVDIGEGLFVPFMQEVRGGAGRSSPVGTLASEVAVTGDSSGGSAIVYFTMSRESFGFRAIVVPTFVSTIDTLGSPEGIRGIFSAGNRRVLQAIEEVKVAIAGSGQNVAKFDAVGVVLEAEEVAPVTVMQYLWSTNTNLKYYNARVFSAVFDAEIIAREGSVSDFLAGVR